MQDAEKTEESLDSSDNSSGGGTRKYLHNRMRAIMAHGYRYAFQPTERLACDAGVSPRTMRRLLAGETAPSFALAEKIAALLSADLRLPLPFGAREVFSPSGAYPTGSTCALCDCEGCYPEGSHDRQGRLRPEYSEMCPGDWCRYPDLPQTSAPDTGKRTKRARRDSSQSAA